MAAGFQICSINKTLQVTFMCLTSCWSARMTEPLQMAAKIKLRMLAVWHVQVKKKQKKTKTVRYLFSQSGVLYCAAPPVGLEYWCEGILCSGIIPCYILAVLHVYLNAVMEQYCYTDWLNFYVQFHVRSQSILNEIFWDHHKPLRQLLECALITSWMLDGFWLILIIHRHSDGTWVWYEPAVAPHWPIHFSRLLCVFPLCSCFQCDVFLHPEPPCGGQRPSNDLLLTRHSSDSGQI